MKQHIDGVRTLMTDVVDMHFLIIASSVLARRFDQHELVAIANAIFMCPLYGSATLER